MKNTSTSAPARTYSELMSFRTTAAQHAWLKSNGLPHGEVIRMLVAQAMECGVADNG
jgi:hypothetical protein